MVGHTETATLKSESRYNLNSCEMKNLLFILAFILISTLTFAKSNENSVNVMGNDSELTVVIDNLATNDLTINLDESQNSYSEHMAVKECTLRGKFTIIFNDGSSYSWEGTLTIVGQTCVEFLKELMAT